MSKKYQERLARSSGFSSKQFKSDFGLKVLKKFGWEEGKGLGKNEDGRDECIQQRRRDGNAGLGAEKKPNEGGWDNWWSDVFNNAAQRIASNATQENEDQDSSDSEDEGAKVAGGGRTTAIKSASRMAGKLKRVVRQEATTRTTPSPSPSPSPSATPSRKTKKLATTTEIQEAETAAPVLVDESPSGKKKRKAEKEETTEATEAADTKEEKTEDEEERAARKKRRKAEKAKQRAMAEEEVEPLMSPELA